MPSTLRTLSLDTPTFKTLQDLTPEGKRARSLAARSVVLATALVLLDGGEMHAPSLSPARKVSFTASMNLETDEILARVAFSLGLGPSEVFRRALQTPKTLAMAAGVLALDSLQRAELTATLLKRVQAPLQRDDEARESA